MKRTTIARLGGLLSVALLAAGCSDSVSPGASKVRAAGAAAVERLAGAGRIEPGGVIITFDFDVQSDLTGRFTASDSSDVRPDGTVGTLRVDASDPQTHFNAFRATSSACSDPTRGAEIDGTGREDTGGLVDFNVVASKYGASPVAPTNWEFGDFNNDGTVNTADFNQVALNYNLALASPPKRLTTAQMMVSK